MTTADGRETQGLGTESTLEDACQRRRPDKNVPVLVRAGMMGDRADVNFAAPEEISGFIKPECWRWVAATDRDAC